MLDHPPRNASQLQSLLAGAGLRLRKNLGQNFLVDRNLRDALVRDAGLQPGDVILEVGVGLGILTEGLLDAGVRVIGVELDEGLLAITRQLLADRLAGTDGEAAANGFLVPTVDHPLRLIEASVLDRKVLSAPVREALEVARDQADRLLLVANLPYNIASTVLIAALEWRSSKGRGIDGVGVLVQLEVARRLIAGPGDDSYGGLSVFCRAHADLELRRRVPGSVFVPRPKVDSAFVGGVARTPDAPAPLGMSPVMYEHFRAAVHAGFQYRRKRLAKSLSLGLEREPGEMTETVLTLGHNTDVRAENLSPEQFRDLAVRLWPADAVG
jgi:16S rRNA (adenine1518-N6/adenine1519-N6)-dimethyltransferase